MLPVVVVAAAKLVPGSVGPVGPIIMLATAGCSVSTLRTKKPAASRLAIALAQSSPAAIATADVLLKAVTTIAGAAGVHTRIATSFLAEPLAGAGAGALSARSAAMHAM